ncbi:MAG: hypothetical protein U5K33_08385 [Halofilum sp. (in: g-proteobacteria)]|nr:hypothetical protein [Halofilum sp. (in: g-proteobacteria)]
MLPDVARYAPAIHSVFGSATGPLPHPISVADQPRAVRPPDGTERPRSCWSCR